MRQTNSFAALVFIVILAIGAASPTRCTVFQPIG